MANWAKVPLTEWTDTGDVGSYLGSPYAGKAPMLGFVPFYLVGSLVGISRSYSRRCGFTGSSLIRASTSSTTSQAFENRVRDYERALLRQEYKSMKSVVKASRGRSEFLRGMYLLTSPWLPTCVGAEGLKVPEGFVWPEQYPKKAASTIEEVWENNRKGAYGRKAFWQNMAQPEIRALPEAPVSLCVSWPFRA